MRQGWLYWKWFFLFLPVLANAGSESVPPILPENSLSLKKSAITISYNPIHKQADWAFYPLGAEQLRDCYDRHNNFRADPSLPLNIASQLSDYSGSGYDRGHISPAGDNKWSASAMNDSFLLSNISPQPPRFNQGIWGRLENLVRSWGVKMGGLWVVTGPVLRDGLRTIGANKVSVPEAYYKAIISQDFAHGIGLELPTNASGNLTAFATTINQIEHDSGLNFFPGIPGEEDIESSLNLNEWDFSGGFQYAPCNRQKPNPGNLADWFSNPN